MRSAISERALAYSVALLLAAGCGGSPSMVEVAVPLPNLPRPGTAMVVFVQPSSYAEQDRFPIFDHAGQFLGDSLPVSWFAAELAPGEYAFFAEGENTAAARAALAADRTYFIEVSPKAGWFRRRVHLLPITPRAATWDLREEWLAESRGHRRIGGSRLDPEKIAEIMEDGRQAWADYGRFIYIDVR
jgi:hypothetical protein